MRKKFMIITITTILFLIIAGCSTEEDTGSDESQQETVELEDQNNQEEYLGKNLDIGVLGTPPEISDEKINFSSVEIEELSIETVEQYDGFFIMEDYLEKAADGPYSDVFEKSDVLFFFIQTEAYYFPFVEDEISYSDYSTRINDEEIYALGYYPGDEENIRTWQLDITAQDPSEEEKEEIIKGLYYEMFNIIRDLEK